MEFIATAIVLSVVLYLIDKNKKWGTFWKLVGGLVVVATLVVAYLVYDHHRTSKILACASKVRATYPDAYHDLDDMTLGKRVLAKYKNCDAPPWAVAGEQSTRYSDLPAGAKLLSPTPPYTDARLKDGTTVRFQGDLTPDKVRELVRTYREHGTLPPGAEVLPHH
jgi:hypothetical protein